MVNIFQKPDASLTAAQEAAQYLEEAERSFKQYYNQTLHLTKNFWLGANGNSGIEILQAMGTNAKAAMTLATARANLLLSAEAALGRTDLIDVSKISAPYNLTFNQDGSLATWTPKE